MDPAGPVDDAKNASPTGPWTAHRARRPQAPQALLSRSLSSMKKQHSQSYFLNGAMKGPKVTFLNGLTGRPRLRLQQFRIGLAAHRLENMPGMGTPLCQNRGKNGAGHDDRHEDGELLLPGGLHRRVSIIPAPAGVSTFGPARREVQSRRGMMSGSRRAP